MNCMTSSDQGLVRIDDPELARDITRARMQLLLEQPSLAAAVMRIPVVQVHSDLLAEGIGIAPGAIIVSQALRLKAQQLVAYAYGHNIIHALFEHLERRGRRQEKEWNIAIDIATAALYDPILDPSMQNQSSEYDIRPPRSTKFDALVQSLGHLSCEQIYQRLIEEQLNKPAASTSYSEVTENALPAAVNLQTKECPLRFDGDPTGCGHRADLDAFISPQNQITGDDHALLLQEVSEALRSEGRLPGKVSGQWSELAKRNRTRRVPWERVFIERLDGLVPMDYQSYPFAKRHLWRGVFLPSCARTGVGRILFAIDTSGSMSLAILGQVVDQIGQLRQCTHCSITIAHFDTTVLRVQDYDTFDDPIDRGSLEMPGRGGTDLRAPFGLLDQRMYNGELFAGIVIATDGYGPLPSKSSQVPAIWLVPGAVANTFNPPFGSVIRCEADSC